MNPVANGNAGLITSTYLPETQVGLTRIVGRVLIRQYFVVDSNSSWHNYSILINIDNPFVLVEGYTTYIVLVVPDYERT